MSARREEGTHVGFTLRRLPLDLKKAFSKYTLESLVRTSKDLPGGKGEMYLRLGASMCFEAVENMYAYYQRRLPEGARMYTATEDSATFVKQESSHAAYHHVLNMLIEPRYERNPLVGRVNRLAAPIFMKTESTMESCPRESDACRVYVKGIARGAAAVETSAGVFEGLALYRVIERDLALYLEHCPELYYLFLYHFAEELEHCEEPIQHFERTYDEPLWSPQNFPHAARDMNEFWMDCFMLGKIIAQKNDDSLSLSEYSDTPFAQERLLLTKKHLRPGLNPAKELADERRSWVERWDREWEPMFRKRMLETMPSSVQ